MCTTYPQSRAQHTHTHTHTHTHILTVEPPLPPVEPQNIGTAFKPSVDVLDLPPDNDPPPLPSVPLPEDEPVSELHSTNNIQVVHHSNSWQVLLETIFYPLWTKAEKDSWSLILRSDKAHAWHTLLVYPLLLL